MSPPQPDQIITESHIEGEGDRVLFRLAVHGHAVLDVLTDARTLSHARKFLLDDAGLGQGMREMRMGSFGPFDVTMTCFGDRSTIALLVDGPDFGPEFRGNQGAGLYVPSHELLAALDVEPKDRD